MRVRLNDNRYVYPDGAVSCDTDDYQDNQTSLQSPRLIIEVISPSTEARDRIVKLACYQQNDGVQEYAIINTTRQLLELYRRKNNGEWSCQHYTTGQAVDFKSIDVQVDVDILYRRTEVPVQ